jgi:hypothetical protein
MAIQPIQNRIFGLPVDASTQVSADERRDKEKNRDSKASKKPLLSTSISDGEKAISPESKDLEPANALLDGQMIDSQNVIELLNHKPAEPRNYQHDKLRQAVKIPAENSGHLNKKL